MTKLDVYADCYWMEREKVKHGGVKQQEQARMILCCIPAPIKPEMPMNRPSKLAELKSWLGDMGMEVDEGGEGGADMLKS